MVDLASITGLVELGAWEIMTRYLTTQPGTEQISYSLNTQASRDIQMISIRRGDCLVT
jgi:hypothetical protein